MRSRVVGGGKADEEQVLHDGEYLRVIAPDEEKFLERGVGMSGEMRC
jgi:hypothetical protein